MKSKLLYISFLFISIFITACGNKNKNLQEEETVTVQEQYDWTNDFEDTQVSTSVSDFNNLSYEYKRMADILMPFRVEYEINYPSNWIDQTKTIAWEEKGYDSRLERGFSRLANFTFDGVAIGDYKEFNIVSPFFRDSLAAKDQGDILKNSVHLDFFRNPNTGHPIIAVNGKALNINKYELGENYERRKMYIWARIDRSNPFLIFNNGELKNIDEESQETNTHNPNDFNSWYGEKDEENYLFLKIEMGNLDTLSPSIALEFDGQEFALTKSSKLESEEMLTPSDIKLLADRYLSKQYENVVKANRVAIDPGNIQQSAVMSNMGMYGKEVVGTNLVSFKEDIIVDNEKFGKVYSSFKNKKGFFINFFENGNPFKTAQLTIPGPDHPEENGHIYISTERGTIKLNLME